MQKLQFYRANKTNTGIAVSFNFGLNKAKTSIDLYASGVKQATWNESTSSGTFGANSNDPTKTFNMKFSEFEAGGIIAALESKGLTPFSGYHSSPAGVTTASVRPHVPAKVKKGNDWVENTAKVATGVSLTLKKDGDNGISFPLVLTYGEATTLAIYLRTGLSEKFLTNLAPANNPAPAPVKKAAPVADDEPSTDAPSSDSGNLDEDVPF
jgi:hypothetical protein